MRGTMQRLRWLLVGLLFPAVAWAVTSVGPTLYTYPKGSYVTLLNDIALNGAAGVRTFNLTQAQVEGMAKAVLTVKRTRVAGTDLTMTCTQSPDGSTKTDIDTCEFTPGSGTCTHYPITWKDGNSSSQAQTWEVPLAGYGAVECIVASTSAGASDKLTILGKLVTQ